MGFTVKGLNHKKPRIRLIAPGLWSCATVLKRGFGATPASAYRDWSYPGDVVLDCWKEMMLARGCRETHR